MGRKVFLPFAIHTRKRGQAREWRACVLIEETKIPWQEESEGPPVTEESSSIKKDSGGEDWMELDRTRQQRVSSHRIQTNTRCEKQLRGEGNRRLPRNRPRRHKHASDYSQEFDDGSPSGPSSTRVEGTTDSVCGRYKRIHSYWIIQQKYEALRFLESKWDPIRKHLARRLIEEQDKVLRSYFAQKGGTRGRGGTWVTASPEHVRFDMCV